MTYGDAYATAEVLEEIQYNMLDDDDVDLFDLIAFDRMVADAFEHANYVTETLGLRANYIA